MALRPLLLLFVAALLVSPVLDAAPLGTDAPPMTVHVWMGDAEVGDVEAYTPTSVRADRLRDDTLANADVARAAMARPTPDLRPPRRL